MAAADDVSRVLAYHERTKHHLPNRFAASRGFLDWQHKPDPFRCYEGAPTVTLARLAPGDASEEPRFDDTYDPVRVPSRPVDHAGVSQLLFDSLALSAWKVLGQDRWALRCNPSSGNLHPTEAYVISGAIAGVCAEPAVHHYGALAHHLERRAPLPKAAWEALGLPPDVFLLALSSIHSRESWKYGERAFRYCQLDVGHAIGAISYAAAALGWHVRAAAGVDDRRLARLLGIHEQRGPEAEHPDVVLWLQAQSPDDAAVARLELSDALLEQLEFCGAPNRLSDEHHPWPVIDEVAQASRYEGGLPLVSIGPSDRSDPAPRARSAREVFRTRRSAVAMDGERRMSAESWFRLLARLLARPDRTPWAALGGSASIHLALFVHRVDDVSPGLYLMSREQGRQDELVEAVTGEPAAPRVDTGDWELPLVLLDAGDAAVVARALCCHQDIASDGVFAVAMIADLEQALRTHGAAAYRRLHWEAGAIGQVLYLEAEAAGLRGTGIGCFFDDGVRQLLGADGGGWHPIYHFTVGGPVDDPRLQTIDAYHHLSP